MVIRTNDELTRDVDGLYRTTQNFEGRLSAMELWRARVGGFLTAMMLMAAAPSVVLAWIALQQIGRHP